MEALEISYKTSTGTLVHRHKLQHFAERALAHDIQSVRLPVSYKDQKHLPGYFWMSCMDALLAYESRLEMAILLQLDFNKTVRHVVSQPFVLHYHEDNAVYRHIPDFLALYDNGAAEVINVKPRQFFATARNRRAFTACKNAAIEMGWAYSTRCEMEPVLLKNLKWLGGYRRQPVGFSQLSRHLIQAAENLISIREAIKTVAELPAIVRPVLFHLLWNGDIQADLHSRMTDDTLIEAASNRSKP